MNIDKVEQLKTHGKARSEKWPKVRKAYLKKHPKCEVCGTKNQVQVHHKKSFVSHPDLELNPQNFITLCEGMERNDHRLFGHLDNYQSININVVKDVALWKNKIKNRPKLDKKTLKWIYPIN